MAKESVDSGLSSYPPQLPLPSLRQFPAPAQPSRPQNQLLSPSTERNLAQTYAVVNAVEYRMSTGSGINSNNNNNGQNPPPNTAASATPLFPRYPPQLQQAPPRVHFGEPKGRQRFRHPSESTRMRAPPPFVRSFSSKAFELPDGLSPPPVLRPSSPQREFVYHHRDTLLDKGIQCEPETAVAQRSQTHSNPLLSALLAAANAVNSPSATVDMDPTLRRKTQFRAGALPYWSDSEVNAYDSPDTFNVAPQSSLGMVSGSKAYPSASVVAAAATAAAMALAAVQSTSRGPATKSLDPPLGAPMSRASLQLEELTPEAATMRSLTGQFAETSLYSRFPASIDQRKSVNSDATPLQKADVYGNTAVDTTQMTPQAPPTTSPLDKNNQRINIGTHYFHETSGSQVRYPLNEENNMIQPSHPLADSPAGRIQERCPPGVGLTIPRTQIPSNLNSSQFNLLSSEPYPSPTQTHRPLISTQSPAHDVPPSRYRPHPHLDSGGGEGVDGGIGRGLLVINVIAGSGLKTTQMPLRDLYCVLETDCVRKARSMIRTSTDYFEWDEVFEVEVEDSRFLSILIYQWDARTRHRLSFYGGIDLTALAQRHLATRSGREEEATEESEDECQPLTSPLIARSGLRFEKIALQLEPRGVLYLQIGFLPMVALYARRDLSASYDAAFFGVSLDELMYRDRMLANLGVVSDSVVPLMIRKCVEEVDRRGTEVVGVYRLSGSVWTKLQVRDLFTRTAEKIAQGLVKRNEKAIRGALAGLDLSADAVPDIHAITATLKDFFRELPEPLFTNALYPMVYEATQVAGPGGSHMGTKLILNILDCLPTSNQEVLLYLLDHLKRITSKSMVNKMNSHNLAVCLAPCLLHPSPAATRDMDSGLLDPNKMVSVLECILDIWP